MRNKNHIKETVIFIIFISAFIALGLLGTLAPESVSWLQSSAIRKWSVALLCGIFFSFVLGWLATVDPDVSNFIAGEYQSNWQSIKSKGKGQYIKLMMVAHLRKVLYFQPFLALLIGWILGWSVNRIVGVVSFINFITICFSFFLALRQWELNEKEQ